MGDIITDQGAFALVYAVFNQARKDMEEMSKKLKKTYADPSLSQGEKNIRKDYVLQEVRRIWELYLGINPFSFYLDYAGIDPLAAWQMFISKYPQIKRELYRKWPDLLREERKRKGKM